MTSLVKRDLKAQELTKEQIDLIKGTIAKGASTDELKLFLTVCNRTGLDPFTHQIWAIKRTVGKTETLVYQIGIDGFRLIAQRSKAKGGPEYKGQTKPKWCDESGTWTHLWLSSKPPFAAEVGVYVEGFVEPITAICEYRRMVQNKGDGNPNTFWAKGAAFQLAKCSEAAALRKAFPNELSGLYLEEEMGAGEEPPPIQEPRSVQEALQPDQQLEQYQGSDLHPDETEAPTEPQDEPKVPESEKPAGDMLKTQAKNLLAKHGLAITMCPDDLTALEARMILSKQSKKSLVDVVERIEKARTGMF